MFFPTIMNWVHHTALGFMSRLTLSQSHTTILTVIGCLSREAHFIALPKHPSANETTNLLTQHVFCLHGIPSDIISEEGPQFIT